MFRKNRALLSISLVSAASLAAVFSWLPAAAGGPGPDPTTSHAQAATARPDTASATGTLTATIDMASLTAKPTQGGKACRLTDHTTLTLTGSVAGTVEGSTTAYVQAPCESATKTPPGTYPTTFTFRGTFSGQVANQPARGQVTYSGTVRTGGNIRAVLTLDGRALAVLKVNAQFGAEGTYKGVTVTRISRS
jgi:hypothetical protein